MVKNTFLKIKEDLKNLENIAKNFPEKIKNLENKHKTEELNIKYVDTLLEIFNKIGFKGYKYYKMSQNNTPYWLIKIKSENIELNIFSYHSGHLLNKIKVYKDYKDNKNTYQEIFNKKEIEKIMMFCLL